MVNTFTALTPSASTQLAHSFDLGACSNTRSIPHTIPTDPEIRSFRIRTKPRHVLLNYPANLSLVPVYKSYINTQGIQLFNQPLWFCRCRPFGSFSQIYVSFSTRPINTTPIPAWGFRLLANSPYSFQTLNENSPCIRASGGESFEKIWTNGLESTTFLIW